MLTLQEIILRGRFIFSGAPKRYEVFKLINGLRSTKEVATKSGRDLSSVNHDLKKLEDVGLIKKKLKEGKVVKKNGCIIYEKLPLAKQISDSYFKEVADTTKLTKKIIKKRKKIKTYGSIKVPSENDILDICKGGEDQLYEFKEPGVSTSKITKEIAAYLHTRKGGIIFYGVEDDGTIIGSDLSKQDLDQRIQNSVRNTIDPPPNIDIKAVNVMGANIILIIIPPWDRKTLYQYTKSEKLYIRKGTNVFVLKPDEIKKLSRGEYIV